MKVYKNPDKKYVKDVEAKLKANNSYCPCKLHKNADTKCMCKEFRDMIKHGENGSCHCGLYILEQD